MKFIFTVVALLTLSLYGENIAFIKAVKGTVLVQENGVVSSVKKGDWLSEKMTIVTKDKSGVTMIFKDNSILLLDSNSILVLEKYLFKPMKQEYSFELKLNKGTASFESGKIGEVAPDSFIFKTPDATVAIRGTKFLVKVQ